MRRRARNSNYFCSQESKKQYDEAFEDLATELKSLQTALADVQARRPRPPTHVCPIRTERRVSWPSVGWSRVGWDRVGWARLMSVLSRPSRHFPIAQSRARGVVRLTRPARASGRRRSATR